MAYLTTTIGDVEYGAAIHHDGLAHGLFHRGRDGSWVQDRGTLQTPAWTTEQQFRRWVLRQLREMAVAMGERPRGGARRGAGHPVTTGSGATRPVSFRLSSEVRGRAEALANTRGVTVDALAREALMELLDGRITRA